MIPIVRPTPFSLLVGLILIAMASPAKSNPPARGSHPISRRMQATVTVATKVIPPFVIQDGDRLTGFSIDLWNAIAAQLGTRTTYLVTPDVNSLLTSVESRKATLGIAAISITADRDARFDFSQPIFDAGLQIMVRPKGGGKTAWGTILTSIFSADLLKFLGAVLVVAFLMANVVWLVERKHHRGIVGKSPYFPGVFEALWWTFATLATQAEEMPKSAYGRVAAVLWMFFSVVFVAYFTAAVTSALTVKQLQSDISEPSDLAGHVIATVKGSTSADYLKEQHLPATTFDTIDEAYDALIAGNVDAIVYDSPVLLYYAAHAGKNTTQLVGTVFRKESYGIVFPPNSPYRKAINNALLALKEDQLPSGESTYDTIYDHWFGSK